MNTFTILLLTLLFVGCSSKPTVPNYQNVQIILEGFTVTTTPGWFIVDGSPKAVILNKRTTPDISEVGWAITSEAPAGLSVDKTLKWIKDQKVADANRDRMVSLSNNFLLKKVNGLNCFSYKQTAQDKKVNKIMSVLGLTCLDPKKTQHYVDLNISQRYDPGAKPFDHGPEADKFFKSLKAK